MKRGIAATLSAIGLAAVLLAGCRNDAKWHATEISGAFPALAFDMTRAQDGKEVTAAEYHGDIVMLYFGYTYCPDVCPTTLTNVAAALREIGVDAKHVRLLFVTVDPDRDSVEVLKSYTAAFAPEIDGLRGTPDALAALARRYRVSYSVTPESKDHAYEVTHSSAIFVFDGSGAVRLLVTSLATPKPDVDGTAADLRRLVAEAHRPGFLARILALI